MQYILISNREDYIFVRDRLSSWLRDYLRFREAFMAITPDNSTPFSYPLVEQNIEIQNVGTLFLCKCKSRTLFSRSLPFCFVFPYFS